MTPPATWRPRGIPASAFILGPVPCQACGEPVWFGRSTTRVLGLTVIGEAKAWREWGRYAVHGCDRASRARARRGKLDSSSTATLIAPNVQRPSARLYSGSEGVDVPEYRRNG